jgi:MinD-like ATPase involved in chromosome partitioning or flagellar assembly
MVAALGVYARPHDVLLFGDDQGAQALLQSPDKLPFFTPSGTCWVVDRRIVGSGWMAEPSSKISSPPRIVFSSLKGGVGRSTALCVTASDLAARGQNVLVIDLDFEAPGLGSLMLPSGREPQFGVVDYLVESSHREINEEELSSFLGLSALTQATTGRIDVLPSFGGVSSQRPENILPKIARAMTEQLDKEDRMASVGEQIRLMIDRFTARGNYDVVLVDSRAGLAEIAAPAVLGLGALVLLFGVAQQQTVDGYRALFSALGLLAVRSLAAGRDADWRLYLKPVYAKASLVPEIAEGYRADLYELFAQYLYEQLDDITTQGDAVNFAADDPDAPHQPLVIPFDPRFVDFDPTLTASQMAKPFYEQTFRSFLDGIDEALDWLRDIGFGR